MVTNTTWENLQLAKHISVWGVNDTDLCIAIWRFSQVVFFTHLEQVHEHFPSLFPIVFGIKLTLICEVILYTSFKSEQSFNIKKGSISANRMKDQILFSFSSNKDEKHSAAPPEIEPRILWNPVARSNHWATKPQQELHVNFRLSPRSQFFFHYEVTRIARIYKHAVTNKNCLDLDPFARPWVRFPVGLHCFSSDPAVSSSIFVGAEREEKLIRNDPDKSEFTIKGKMF